VTSSRFRRRSRERKLALAGDFPDTGETVTELIAKVEPPSYDSTIPFGGASAGTMPPAEAHREAGPKQAIWMTSPDTQPLRLRAQPPQPQPRYAPPGPRDTGPMPKLSRFAARPRPQRPADGFIPVWSTILQQHIMLCGICRHTRYADPIAVTLPFAFEALRVSAWTAGWRLDAFDRWGCPGCQKTPAWHARYTVTLYDDRAAQARLARDADAERWWRGAAEHAVREHTLRHYDDSHARGTHAAVTR
jgi:hypothetical protein